MRPGKFLAALGLVLLASAVPAAEFRSKVDSWVLDRAARGDAEFLVMLRAQADLSGARRLTGKTARSAFVLDSLRSTAQATQRPLLDLLEARGVAHRAFWVANMIWVRGGASLVDELADREDALHTYSNPPLRLSVPVARKAAEAPQSPDTIDWCVADVRAPQVWALGYTGQGIVVGGQDTGYQWDHPALKNKYRGWNGSAADHNYNWHDSIHSDGGVCGPDSPFPCDDTDHGTHTMGTMVGDDG